MEEQGRSDFNVCFGDAVLTTYLGFPKQRQADRDPGNSEQHHHSHPYYELFCIKEGEASVVFDTHSVIIHAGEALLIPPCAEHQSIQTTGRGNITTFQFSVSLHKGTPFNGVSGIFSLFQERLSQCAETRRPFPIQADTILDIRLFRSFSASLKADDYCCAQALLYRVFYSLLKQLPVFIRSNSYTVSKKLTEGSRMVLLIDNLINNEACTQKDIASALGYSVSQTKRIIKSIYGSSFRKIRMERFLKTACVLLENDPGISIGQAARMAGFSDVSVMRNAFRSFLDCTPEEYRDSHKVTSKKYEP